MAYLMICLMPARRVKMMKTHIADTAISATFRITQNCMVSLNSLYCYRAVLPDCQFDG